MHAVKTYTPFPGWLVHVFSASTLPAVCWAHGMGVMLVGISALPCAVFPLWISSAVLHRFVAVRMLQPMNLARLYHIVQVLLTLGW